MIGAKRFRLAILVNGRAWQLYDLISRDEYEMSRLLDELMEQGTPEEHIRVLSGRTTYEFYNHLKELNIALLTATIPEVDLGTDLEPDDIARLRIEQGYGCDRDEPYVCSLVGFDVGKLVRLFGRVAAGELVDDRIVAG